MKQFEEKFGKRVLVNCNDLSFNLQSCVAENEEGPTTNVSRISFSFSFPHQALNNRNIIIRLTKDGCDGFVTAGRMDLSHYLSW